MPRVRIATGCHPHNAKHYDNDFMQNRFQTMTMNVDDATRADR